VTPYTILRWCWRLVASNPAAALVALEDRVACFPRDPELATQGRHFLAVEQASHKSEPLVHDVTLFARFLVLARLILAGWSVTVDLGGCHSCRG
jgi:hypothetical protein